MNRPKGSVRSLEKSGPRLNSLRFTPLRQTPLYPDFSALAHRFKGGLKARTQLDLHNLI